MGRAPELIQLNHIKSPPNANHGMSIILGTYSIKHEPYSIILSHQYARQYYNLFKSPYEPL